MGYHICHVKVEMWPDLSKLPILFSIVQLKLEIHEKIENWDF